MTDWTSISAGLDWVQARDGRMTRPSLDVSFAPSPSLGSLRHWLKIALPPPLLKTIVSHV